MQALDGNDSTSSIREFFFSKFFSGACKPKEWEQAVHILRTLMPKADIEPDAQSYEHVAAACEEGLAPWAALRLLYGVLPRRFVALLGAFFQDQ